MYGSFTKFKNTAASILNAQNKQLKFFAEARKYPNAFEASLDRTNVPTSVYLNLIEAVHKNVDKMHRYVRLRKKLLGVDELHFYDIYTPPSSSEIKQKHKSPSGAPCPGTCSRTAIQKYNADLLSPSIC